MRGKKTRRREEAKGEEGRKDKRGEQNVKETGYWDGSTAAPEILLGLSRQTVTHSHTPTHINISHRCVCMVQKFTHDARTHMPHCS